jgi:Fe-S-cluster-containing dehydrogenase component
MAKYGLAVDVEKCTGCYACFLACKDEYVGNDYPPTSAAQPKTGHSWIRIEEVEHGAGTKIKVDYVPIPCQQCADAPCIQPNNSGAVYRRADGIVVIDPVKAKGRKEIVELCPYGAIFWNDESQLAQKCTLCAHMLDGGEMMTRCAEVCPTKALVFGDYDDPQSAVSQLLAAKPDKVESYKPEYGANPVMKYACLPKPFIAGEVVLADKLGETAIGAKVTLQAKGDKKILTAETNFFGDFEFKDLAKDAEYLLKAEYEGYLAKEVTVRTDASLNVGELVLAAK